MNQSLIQQLTAAANAMQAASPASTRIKNIAAQVRSAAEALRLYEQDTGNTLTVNQTISYPSGIKWQDVPERSVLTFGEQSRGTCSQGVFLIKLRDCRPFINAYQLYFNGVFVCSSLSFTGAKESALKHYERLLRLTLGEQCVDKAQFASLGTVSRLGIPGTHGYTKYSGNGSGR